jgi:glycerol-3-phosphate acyltransferase PlsY
MLRTFGKASAAATFAGDALKCVVAILTVRFLTAGLPAPWGEFAQMAAGTGTFIGHCFPLYFGFKGGKGMVVGAAILALIDWRLFLVAVTVFIAVIVFTRMVSLGSVSAAFAFALAALLLYRNRPSFVVWAIMMLLFTLYTHRGNIKRIISGTESRIGEKNRHYK